MFSRCPERAAQRAGSFHRSKGRTPRLHQKMQETEKNKHESRKPGESTQKQARRRTNDRKQNKTRLKTNTEGEGGGCAVKHRLRRETQNPQRPEPRLAKDARRQKEDAGCEVLATRTGKQSDGTAAWPTQKIICSDSNMSSMLKENPGGQKTQNRDLWLKHGWLPQTNVAERWSSTAGSPRKEHQMQTGPHNGPGCFDVAPF